MGVTPSQGDTFLKGDGDDSSEDQAQEKGRGFIYSGYEREAPSLTARVSQSLGLQT